MRASLPLSTKLIAASMLAAVALGVGAAPSAFATQRDAAPGSPPPAHPLTARVVVSGNSLSHRFTPAGSTTMVSEHLSKPDDVARLGHNLFVGFQNGVGPQGEASSSGNGNSTIVEFRPDGTVVGSGTWSARPTA